MGLVARAMEEAGIASVAIQAVRELAERVKPPRSLFVKFPYGQALGEPGKPEQHHAVIREALRLLVAAKEGGAISDPGFRWRRWEEKK